MRISKKVVAKLRNRQKKVNVSKYMEDMQNTYFPKKQKGYKKSTKNEMPEIPTNKEKCILCNKRLKNDDIDYEDYYRLSRGHTINAGQYFVCFDCFQNKLLYKLFKL